MNRIRLTVLSSFAAFGILGLGASPSRAQDQYMGGATAPVSAAVTYSRFYQAPASVPIQAPTYHYVPRYYAPALGYRLPAPRSHVHTYDPSGRHDNLARPWLSSR